VITNAHFHCWRHAQSLVNPAKIIVHVMKRNGVLQIFALLLLLVFLLPLAIGDYDYDYEDDACFLQWVFGQPPKLSGLRAICYL
jgi:hypothetical protein